MVGKTQNTDVYLQCKSYGGMFWFEVQHAGLFTIGVTHCTRRAIHNQQLESSNTSWPKPVAEVDEKSGSDTRWAYESREGCILYRFVLEVAPHRDTLVSESCVFLSSGLV